MALYTHTHTHTQYILEDKENVKKLIIFIPTIIAIILAFALIIVIDNKNKNLDKIIYRAKKEAENTLISSGLATYTKDIEDDVGAISIARNDLPENTTETPQGTVVLPKENWNIETVTAVSVGNGETVPVPIGFYYVGGDLSTGVIISDDKTDEYDGETDKTTWEYTTELKGNQFVWIPCKEEEYKKCEVWNGITQKTTGTTSLEGTLCNAGWEKITSTAELLQIRKYEGYYVARYEAGLSEKINEFTSRQGHADGSNQVYNIDKINGVLTKPQSRAGVVPWNFIDWAHSQTNTKNMYNTVSVSSGLITGTQWDVMLNTFLGKKKYDGTELTGTDLTSSGNWGNYVDNSIEYTGRVAKVVSGNPWYQYAFGGETTGKTTSYDLLTTGASKQTGVYHIYDVAGNLFEWTDECALWKQGNGNETNIQAHVCRGGSSEFSFGYAPACYRSCFYPNNYTRLHGGFRVVLYMK